MSKPEPTVPLDPVTPLTYLASALLWTLAVIWFVPSALLMWVLALTVGSHRSDIVGRIYTRTQIALTMSRWRAEVHPSIEADRQYIFAQNHVNIIDHCAAYPATHHFMQGVELASHFKVPFYGWFMKARGTIGVQRGMKRVAQLTADIKAELEEGRSILVFPEGHRTMTGRMGPFRPSLFFIARDLGAPIIPTVVTGWYETKRKGSLLIRPGYHVTVHCLEPIETKGLTDDEVLTATERCWKAMVEVEDAYWARRADRLGVQWPQETI